MVRLGPRKARAPPKGNIEGVFTASPAVSEWSANIKFEGGVEEGDGRVGWVWHKARRWVRGMPIDYGGRWQPQVGGGDPNRRTHVRKIESLMKFDKNRGCCLRIDG